MDAELKAVQDAEAQMHGAKTATDTLNALGASMEATTRAAGAKAAGISADEYQLISSTLSPLVGEMTPVEQEMDMSGMPAQTVAAMNESRLKSLEASSKNVSPQLIDALRPRAAALRKQSLALTAERVKAAGMSR
jgi:hypothetical protein